MSLLPKKMVSLAQEDSQVLPGTVTHWFAWHAFRPDTRFTTRNNHRKEEQ